MNFKTKAIGILAGSALAVSVAGGVIAAPGDTTVNLDDGSSCAASITIATSSTLNLGDWTWNGTSYEKTADSESGTLIIGVTNSEFGVTQCNVPVTIDSPLVSATDPVANTDTIPASAVLLNDGSGNAAGGKTYTVAQNTDLTLTATLDATVLNTTPPQPDDYEGVITVGVASAAN